MRKSRATWQNMPTSGKVSLISCGDDHLLNNDTVTLKDSEDTDYDPENPASYDVDLTLTLALNLGPSLNLLMEMVIMTGARLRTEAHHSL